MGLTRLSSEGTPAAPCLSLASFTRAFHSRLPGRRFCTQGLPMLRMRLLSAHLLTFRIGQTTSTLAQVPCSQSDSMALSMRRSAADVGSGVACLHFFPVLCISFTLGRNQL